MIDVVQHLECLAGQQLGDLLVAYTSCQPNQMHPYSPLVVSLIDIRGSRLEAVRAFPYKPSAPTTVDFWHLKRLTVPQTLNSDSRISSMSSSFRVRISAVLMLFRSFSTVELFLLNSHSRFSLRRHSANIRRSSSWSSTLSRFFWQSSTISRRIFGSTLSQTAGILPSPSCRSSCRFCSSSSSSILASRDSVSGQDRDTHTKIPRLERHNILVLYCFCLV